MKLFNSNKVQVLAIVLSLGLAGCLTDDDGDDNGNNGDPVTTRNLTAGAQDNASIGSSIDLDDFQVYLAAAARPKAADIDLVFGNSSATLGGVAIYSPDVAKNGVGGSGGFTFMNDWSTTNTTIIKTVSNVTISNITTTDQVDSLWAVGQVQANGRLYITAGDTFLARSNQGKTVLVRVTTVTQGDDGTAQLTGIAKF